MNICSKSITGCVLLLASFSLSAGQPAARVGDTMDSGGVILPPGAPTVLIGGKPAARITDMTTSPLVLEGPLPCVGGPIIPPGSPTVLIGSLPAARVGDLAATQCGPPQTISTGDFTVLIGP